MRGDDLQRTYRVRIVVFLVLVVLATGSLGAAYRTVNTLRYLEVVESARDEWQRPDDVLRALGVRPGDTAVDLGSGVGYFALKLAPRVGERGWVMAVDIRRMPLAFLRLRAAWQRRHNVRVIRSGEDDPRLPELSVDAVLVANTYHELADPGAVLDHVFRALRPGGRLVVVDPTPGAGAEDGPETATHHYERPATAETELRGAGFAILDRDDRFIDSGRHRWWMIVARRDGPRSGAGATPPARPTS